MQQYDDNSNDDDDWCALPIEVRVWAFHKNTCALHLQTYTVHTLCASMLFEKDKCQFYTQRRTDTCIWSTPIILSRVTFDLCVALIILSSNMSQVIESIAFVNTSSPIKGRVVSPNDLVHFLFVPPNAKTCAGSAPHLGIFLLFRMKLIQTSILFIEMVISVSLAEERFE